MIEKFAVLLCLVGYVISCPLFCNCMFERIDGAVQSVWHCGYQELTNDRLDLIIEGHNVSEVNRLYLDGNKIALLQTSKFENFSSLKYLSLDKNLISKYPSTLMKDVPTIESLSLTNNSIETIQSDELVRSGNLKTLNLSGNTITSLGSVVFSNLDKLQTLDISSNKIHTISPESLHGLESLKKLNLAKNLLDVIPDQFLNSIHNVVDLNLSGNQISNLKQGLLVSFSHLTYADLSNNGIRTIEDKVFKGFQMKQLDLSGNEIKQISTAVFQDSAIGTLNLERNPLTCGCSLKSLISSLNQNVTSVSSKKFTVSGSCGTINNEKISIENITSKLDCRFDCMLNGMVCQNNGKCSMIADVSETLSYKCDCRSGYSGNHCENEQKDEGLKKWIVAIMIIIPVLIVIIGLIIFWCKCRKQREAKGDNAPLTDEDFAL